MRALTTYHAAPAPADGPKCVAIVRIFFADLWVQNSTRGKWRLRCAWTELICMMGGFGVDDLFVSLSKGGQRIRKVVFLSRFALEEDDKALHDGFGRLFDGVLLVARLTLISRCLHLEGWGWSCERTWFSGSWKMSYFWKTASNFSRFIAWFLKHSFEFLL